MKKTNIAKVIFGVMVLLAPILVCQADDATVKHKQNSRFGSITGQIITNDYLKFTSPSTRCLYYAIKIDGKIFYCYLRESINNPLPEIAKPQLGYTIKVIFDRNHFFIDQDWHFEITKDGMVGVVYGMEHKYYEICSYKILTPYLGIMGRDTPEDFLSVARVAPDGPADKAGLMTSDIIFKINGDRISSTNTLTEILNKYKPGDKVNLKILRLDPPFSSAEKGAKSPELRTITIQVILGDRN